MVFPERTRPDEAQRPRTRSFNPLRDANGARGYNEVVLLNEKGEVAECTSANIFVVRGNQVATPPLSSGCLPGITRALLLEEIHAPGIEITERTLLPRDLEEADQVFITSSTRDLLPVSEIESLKVRSEGKRVVATLSKAFREYRESYVAKREARLSRA